MLDTEITSAMSSVVNQIIDPLSVEAARKQKDWPEWETSIKAKLNIHKRLETGELVIAQPNVNIVGSQLVLCYKFDKDGGITLCKLRLVAQGFTQQEGINFNETFSPTSKLTAVRIIEAIAVMNDWEMEQTDVDMVYFNAILEEDIYI